MRRLTDAQPMDYGAVNGIVGALTVRYPFLGAAPIGSSPAGRTIWGMTLGGGRHRVLITAEQATSLVALRLCEELCEALDGYRSLNGWDVHRAMRGRCVVFVPCAHPDTTYYSTADSQENQPFDPKNDPLAALCRRIAFRHIVTLREHREGILWRCGTHTPAESELIARVLGAASGFPVLNTLTHGELKDWFVKEFHRPGFTLGMGEISPKTFEKKYKKSQEMLLISALL